MVRQVLASTGLCGVREPFELADGWGMLSVMVGATAVSTVVVSTGYDEPDLDTLRDQTLLQPTFVVLVGLTMLASAVWLAMHILKPLRACTIDAWTTGGESWPTLVSSVIGACGAGFTQVFMKLISEALHEIADGSPVDRVASQWALWVGALGLLYMGAANLGTLQLLLGPGKKVSLAVPAYQSLTVLATVGIGAYYLQELTVYSDAAPIMTLVGGVMLTIGGLVWLSYRQEQRRARAEAVPDENKETSRKE
jgi:hypothetical protein